MQGPFLQSEVGIVVIGRNEGQRLNKCLTSAKGSGMVVYVDSGSEDGSTHSARRAGAVVVELDTSKPFTAARARNAGFHALLRQDQHLDFVQFVDADCELMPNWIHTACSHLAATPETAIVCGTLLERSPDTSIYNRLCALEWRSLPGDTDACGGIFMIKREVFETLGGFNESLIAGEEPELCHRLRADGWKILRVDEPMANHDAAITRFCQWWKRAVREGHSYAERARLHRESPERPWRREVRRNWFWALFLPVAAVAAAWPTNGVSLALLALYPIWLWKISLQRRRFGDLSGDAWLYAVFCMLAKFPSFIGQMIFWWRRLRGRRTTLIEYKTATCKPPRQRRR